MELLQQILPWVIRVSTSKGVQHVVYPEPAMRNAQKKDAVDGFAQSLDVRISIAVQVRMNQRLKESMCAWSVCASG